MTFLPTFSGFPDTLKTEVLNSSETLIRVNQSARRHIPEDRLFVSTAVRKSYLDFFIVNCFYWHGVVPCYSLLPGIHCRNKFLAGNVNDMSPTAVKTRGKSEKKKLLKVYTTQWKLPYLVWDVGFMTYENVAGLEIEFEVLRIVIPCSLVGTYNRFRRTVAA